MNADHVRRTCVDILDVATKFSTFIRADSKDSGELANALLESWINLVGVPDHIIDDQAGEFFKHFGRVLKKMSIASTITATQAPWQRGMVGGTVSCWPRCCQS
jgi:hypothetical protein